MTIHSFVGFEDQSLVGGLGGDLSWDFGPHLTSEPLGADPGLWLADDGNSGSFAGLLGANGGTIGADDGAVGPNWPISASQPTGISVPSQPATAGDASASALAPTASLADRGGGSAPAGSDLSVLVDFSSTVASAARLRPFQITENGITFVANWDRSVGSAPSGFTAGFEQAVENLLGSLAGPIGTVGPIKIALNVGWGEVGGSRLLPGALGESSTQIEQVDYATLQSRMSYLPAGAPTSGAIWVATAEEKALGLGVQDPTITTDGAVGFGSRFTWNFTGSPGSGQYDFISTAEHEISEVMGRIALLGKTVQGVANGYTPFDLFRYTADGTRSLTGGDAAYFSFDGGKTSSGNSAAPDLTYFNQVAGGDWGDWQSSGAHSAGNDAFDAFSSAGVAYSTGPVDQLVMDVLGYGALPVVS